MAAYVASDILKGKPIYDVLLHRILLKKDDYFQRGENNKKIILEIVVCVGSALDQRQVKDVKWPSNCLLVGIRRGEAEIIPHGVTTILAGDYMSILANEAQAPKTSKTLQLMAEAISNRNSSK